jgi:predicted protein tyrosine phosphatase
MKHPNKKESWISEEELSRVNSFSSFRSLYEGDHTEVFTHPYAAKIEEYQESIPYYSNNILGKASDAFADLIVDSGIKFVTSQEKLQKVFEESIDLSFVCYQVLVCTSFSGFMGLQPYYSSDEQVKLLCIPASNLIVTLDSFHEVSLVQKFNIFYKEGLQLLFLETHYPDRYEISGGEINGNVWEHKYSFEELKKVFQEDIPELQNISSDTVIHNLGNFLISIVFNKKLLDKFYTDYSPTAVQLQKGLNARETMIARILDQHANPKLMAPRTFAKKDPVTGQWNYQIKDKEIIFVETSDEAQLFSYLTWEGQLTAAQEQRDHLILSLCNELSISPVFLEFTNLVSSSTADTSAKFRKMMKKTLSLCNKKRELLYKALVHTVTNLGNLMQLPEIDFNIEFPVIHADTEEEVLEKTITKKQAGLLSTKKAIQITEQCTKEEAVVLYNDILQEKKQENMSFDDPSGGASLNLDGGTFTGNEVESPSVLKSEEEFPMEVIDLQILDVETALQTVQDFPKDYRVVSIMDDIKTYGDTFEEEMLECTEEVLFLVFYDTDNPSHDKACTLEDCEKALEFLSKGGKRIIHCAAGISRSTAIALGYFLKVFSTYEEAVDYLFVIRAEAKPNTLVVTLMCQLLGIDSVKVLQYIDR